MSGKQKALLIVIGVVLVVLLVVGFGLNSGKDQGNPRKPNAFASFLHKFAPNISVDPAKVSGGNGCTAVPNAPHSFTFQGACTLIVQDPGAMRMLYLKGDKPFHAKAPGPGKSEFSVEADASPKPPGVVAQISVDKPTAINLTCNAGVNVPCVVTIAKSAD
jgi:hypothetical protein